MRSLVLGVVLLVAAPALARDVDFSKPIVDLDGKNIPTTNEKDSPALDLDKVATTALLSEKAGAQSDPSDKMHRFALALKIHKAGAVDLSAEEIAQIKAAIASTYSALVVGRANEILDPGK